MNRELDAEASVSVLLSDSHMGCTRTLQINDEKIDLKIPSGIRDGQKLRIRGKGNYQPGTGMRGDLYIVVRVLGATNNANTSSRHIGTGRAEAVIDAKMTGSLPVDNTGNFIRIKDKARVRVVALDGKTQPEGGRLTLILATERGIELVCHNGDVAISAKKVVGIEKTSREANGDTITIRTKNTTFAIDHYGDAKELDSILSLTRNALIRENRTSPREASSSNGVRRDTTYRNSGVGTEEVIGKTQTTKRHENPSNSSSTNDARNIQEHIFWTNNNSFFYGKIAEWKEGRGNSFYAKNDTVCELRCFTPDSRPPFTEYVRATCDMRVTERLAVIGQQIPNSCPLFRYVPQSSKSSHQDPSSQRGRASSDSAKDNQIMDPIEGLDNFIGIVKDSYAFQVRDVLERIVNTERERIESERGLWKVGAGIAAFAFGVSIDGFDPGDLVAGYSFSNIGGMAHQFASKEQIEFLKKLQSEWLVLERSPMDIRRRLGESQGRFIGISRSNRLDMFNIHQSGSRGFHLVELDYAGNIAKGFKDPRSLEVLQRSFDEEDIGTLSNQLYPGTITPLKLCRTITAEEAMRKDPYYNQISKAGAPFRVVYSDDSEGVMYKIPTPHHSDY